MPEKPCMECEHGSGLCGHFGPPWYILLLLFLVLLWIMKR